MDEYKTKEFLEAKRRAEIELAKYARDILGLPADAVLDSDKFFHCSGNIHLIYSEIAERIIK